MQTPPTATFDFSGLRCPHPILQTKKQLAHHAPGDIIKLICTDPDTLNDMKIFCQRTGHQLLEAFQEENKFIFLIQKC